MNEYENQYEGLQEELSVANDTYTHLQSEGVPQDTDKQKSAGGITTKSDELNDDSNVYDTIDPKSIDVEETAECCGRPWIKWVVLTCSLIAVASSIVLLVLYIYWNTKQQCTEKLCGEYGTCVLLPSNQIACRCHAGYTGQYCDEVAALSNCENNPCGPHGACSNTSGPDGYKCQCHEWYTGESCATIIAPEFHRVNQWRNYSFPYLVGGITDTSIGELVLVEWDGPQVAIYTTTGHLKSGLDIPGSPNLWGIARQDHTLFISNTREENIHIVIENNTYVGDIVTGITGMCGIAVSDRTIWVTAQTTGVHQLDLDHEYNIVSSAILAKSSDMLKYPLSISVMAGLVAVLSHYSSNIHLFNTTGHLLVPPVGERGKANGQLSGPRDLVMDPVGRMYVADYGNSRVVLFSSNGTFLRNLVTEKDGLAQPPTALFIRFNSLYIITDKPIHMYAVELE